VRGLDPLAEPQPFLAAAHDRLPGGDREGRALARRRERLSVRPSVCAQGTALLPRLLGSLQCRGRGAGRPARDSTRPDRGDPAPRRAAVAAAIVRVVATCTGPAPRFWLAPLCHWAWR